MSICKAGLLLLLRVHTAFLDLGGVGGGGGGGGRGGGESWAKQSAETADHLASMTAAILENLAGVIGTSTRPTCESTS